MIINLRELTSKGTTVQLHGRIPMDPLIKGSKDIVRSKPLDAELEAKPIVGAVVVSGQLSAEMELICSRCLIPFTETLHIPFHEVFSQKPLTADQEEEGNVHLVTDDKVDIQPYAEENVVLGLPYIALCDEACKGLCPVCGQNLNEKSCDCVRDNIDPRLAGLKDFFNN